ncbi:MAG: rhomboid family intramembrane serine protease [Gammaproteobacteria bacterium]|nr:rhomboid family intramembrane serine protease [Gammaproteobacteria bacterium]
MSVIGPATLLILVVNVGLSLYGLYVAPSVIERCVFRPHDFARGINRSTALTSGFVHADLPHLLFNMLSFWFFAPLLERRIGTPAFVLLYLFGLFASQVGSYSKHRHDPQYATLGASGAISAVLFAAIIYFPTMSLFIIPIPVPIPAPLFAVGYLAYSWWSAKQNRGRINHDAHFGGALAGIVFVALFDPRSLQRLLSLL